jgi:hypothetical protein
MKHKLDGDAETGEVYLDGKWLDPRPGQKVWKKSSAFSWGYGGSGPAQLALSIVLKLTGDIKGFQDFKWAVIAKLPEGQDFEIEFEYPLPQADAPGDN